MAERRRAYHRATPPRRPPARTLSGYFPFCIALLLCVASLAAPAQAALVLGDRAEDSFRQSMLIAQCELGIFFSYPLVGGITGLALVMLFWPPFSVLRAKWRVR